MKHIIIMSIFTALFGSKTSNNNYIKVLSAQEFRAQITNKNVQLIDVRTPKEYNSGHIKNAKNIDFFSSKFNAQFDKLDKDKAIYVYCRSGSRSKQASKKIVTLGFKEIYDLKGGFLNYN
ncbi:rhodanese-like domain-containing protein [Olleya sediminilitoris]|nr:rhodanese-like domain-containing protein [Olleya sediminilitoris]